LTQERWNEVFDLYKQSPEYNKVNVGMDLAGFKQIYWFEFAHRILGRSIGIVFLIPFLYFLLRGRIRPSLTPKLIALFVLGGLQGLLGWYMVKSGLVDNPHVSQYRLTAHLGLAIVIYAYMFWISLDLLFSHKMQQRPQATRSMRGFAGALAGLVFLTILSGGFVAGLKAGLAYNTFPLMDGRLVPEALLVLEPAWRNFFENVATVQFDHRVLAILTVSGIIVLWIISLKHALPKQLRIGMHALLAAALLQATLGIATLLLVVPVTLAAAHQAGALLLFSVILFVNHRLGHWQPQEQAVTA
jgi:cytochrome c oxidase assembly protein subunit 15